MHRSVGGFRPKDARGCYDFSFWVRALRRGVRIQHINEPLEMYLARPTSHGHRTHAWEAPAWADRWTNECDSPQEWEANRAAVLHAARGRHAGSRAPARSPRVWVRVRARVRVRVRVRVTLTLTLPLPLPLPLPLTSASCSGVSRASCRTGTARCPSSACTTTSGAASPSCAPSAHPSSAACDSAAPRRTSLRCTIGWCACGAGMGQRLRYLCPKSPTISVSYTRPQPGDGGSSLPQRVRGPDTLAHASSYVTR